MQQIQKNLKTSSVIVLALAGLTLLNILFELFFGELSAELSGAATPEGASDNVVLIAKIFILAVSVIMLLPQAYIGFKGIKLSKTPDKSGAHIIWGIILIVFTAAGLISPLVAFFSGDGEAFADASEFLSIAVDAFVLYEYVKHARALRSAA